YGVFIVGVYNHVEATQIWFAISNADLGLCIMDFLNYYDNLHLLSFKCACTALLKVKWQERILTSALPRRPRKMTGFLLLQLDDSAMAGGRMQLSTEQDLPKEFRSLTDVTDLLNESSPDAVIIAGP